MLYYNRTKLTQLLYTGRDAYPVAIHPKMVTRLDGYKDYCKEDFNEFQLNLINGCDQISIHRDYALGDLLQLIPVCRIIKKKLNVKKINIITSSRFYMDLSYMFTDISVLTKECLYTSLELGYIFNTNGLLEKDHSITNSENIKHRVFIYLNFFGINDVKSEELNWNLLQRGNIIVPELNHSKKLIGLQLRGSGYMKTLPYEMIKQIAYSLAKDHYVVLIDHDKDMGFNGPNIINLCGLLKVPQVIALLTKLDMCITMDSGVLWMAHCANCPTLTFLASTREQERISLHPQYPLKAKAIDLTKYIGCEPCFETKVNCGGKIRCMKEVTYDMIESELHEKVKSILGVK